MFMTWVVALVVSVVFLGVLLLAWTLDRTRERREGGRDQDSPAEGRKAA